MKKKVLIVDDEKITLMMTNHILSTEFDTIMASSGEEALAFYGEKRPDLVLSDFRMPGMTGMELQKELQQKFEENIPFIFMTADRDEEIESEGLHQGAMDFIHKPFRADVLLKRISNILKMTDQIKGLKKASETDPMTGLLNKASATAEIREKCKDAPGALMILDLDSFKLVNDIYGHAAGDKILIRFSEILQSAVRFTDITGRIGGDEFIAYCQGVGEESVIAEKSAYINENMLSSAHELLGEDMSIPLGVSIGCVFVPNEGDDYHSLFQKADKALYNVKQNGKHGYQIYHDTLLSSQGGTKGIADIQKVSRILSERSLSKGAYSISLEQFRMIYRFLSRLVGNYKKEVWLLLFSVKLNEDNGLTADEVSSRFMNVLQISLRQSDVITQNNNHQILAILCEINRLNCEIVIERVLSNWKEEAGEINCEVHYEMEMINV